MPVLLKEAKIGEVLKPPRNAMYAMNGILIMWEREYKVVRKDPKNKSVWINMLPHMVEYLDAKGKKFHLSATTLTPTSERMGSIQVDEDGVWLTSKDPQPTDKVRIVKRGETSEDGEPKRRRGGPDTEYEFAFDDEEITLDDMPSQAQILGDIFLEIYQADGTKSWSEKEIDEILHREENVARLHTTQDPMIIFKFYRAPFARKGFIKRRD